MQRSEVPTRT